MEVELGSKEGTKEGPGAAGEEGMKVDLADGVGDDIQLNNNGMSLKLGNNEEDRTTKQEVKSISKDKGDVLTVDSNSKNSEADSAAGVESYSSTTEKLYDEEFNRRFLN